MGEVMMRNEKKKPKAVVVGGSIAGVSCAHALLRAGWEVVVVEKSSGPPKGCSTGAGLAIDSLSCKIIQSWLNDPDSPYKATLPFTIFQIQVTDGETKNSKTLTRDENCDFRVTHWAHLHQLLGSALPEEIFMWGHLFLSLSISDDKSSVTVKAKALQTGEIVEITGDLLVAADGCQSSVRKTFLPGFELRYTGYCAWRGVLDFSEIEDSDVMRSIRKAYPDLGKCVYTEYAASTHCVFYELFGKRMNWVWYVNQPEPKLKGSSLTMRPSEEMVKKLHSEAEKVWGPELARLIRETKEPFLNVMYDSDPFERIFWDNVVLIGEAAHPITPHTSRSTNGSILGAAVLGKCLEKYRGLENLHSALYQYESIRLPVMAKQVIHSRYLGRFRQGLPLPGQEPFDPKKASEEVLREIQLRNTPSLAHVPDILVDLS